MDEQPGLPERYDFEASEPEVYSFWEDNQYFQADAESDKESFVVMIPPPNVTGSLHMGHAVNGTLQDVLVRFHRMDGKEALWVPGTDHAGIATQNVVEKQLQEEGITRHDLSREAFLEKVWDWKEKYENRITGQLKRIGASCDWSRQRFTMDEGYIDAINEAFIRLYEQDLIYRDEYIIHWCPRCETSLSNLEVEHEETQGKLWYINYPLVNGDGRTLTVATTRPETMLGDTGVAVHPEDDRFADLQGKSVLLPLRNKEIPIVADDFVDHTFGAGAVKVTPAHDEADYACAERNGLEVIQIIDSAGNMTAEAGAKYAGMDRFECREQVVEDLREEGYLEKIEDYDLTQNICYRCDTVLEPYLSTQWFVDMEPLADSAIQAGRENRPQFYPERWQDVYIEWLEDTPDWCISRQLWWGHQIPIWFCENCNETIGSIEEPSECENCGGVEFVQESDVLDTWFSSALWPFATLGWPGDTADLEKFYPTDTLVTARDIIHLWVARMVFTGLEFLGEEPFDDVYINPTILNPEGRRMSKSLGTGIDPLEVIDDVGADATRFGLTRMTTGTQDVKFSPQKIEESRNLVTKVWNAFRLFYQRVEEKEELPRTLPDPGEVAREDRWILSRHNRCIRDMREALDTYQFSDVASTFYHHFWDEFCDWYLEWVKERLDGGDEREREQALTLLNYLFQSQLRLLHPMMPFVTEELWQNLRTCQVEDISESIMIAPYPDVDEKWMDDKLDREIGAVQETVRGVRSIRNRMNISPHQTLDAFIAPEREETAEWIRRNRDLIEKAAETGKLAVDTDLEKPEKSGAFVREGIEGYVPLADVIDVDAEIRRLEDQLDETESELEHVTAKLENEDFVRKAPDDVVQRERDRKENLQEERRALKENLADWKE